MNRGYFKTGNLPNRVVDKLHNSHLVRVEDARGGKWYELSHDRFIPPILQSNAKWATQGESPLALAAQDWIKANHEESFLFRGQMLRKAQASYLRQWDKLNPVERDFLTASINNESRRTRQNYIWMGITILVTVAALAVAAFGLYEYREEKDLLASQREITNKVTAELLKELGLTSSEHLPEQIPIPPSPSPNASPMPERPEITVNNPVVGKLRWSLLPDGGVEYLDDWDSLNIVTVDIPQLRNVKGANNGKVQFNRLAADQLKAAWAEVEAQGLLDRVLVWNGSFARKSVRGTLSSHALGLAFDINYENNRTGLAPPDEDEEGSVRALVQIFQKYGFIWGGNWNIPEGAHFQVGRIVKQG